MQFGVDYVPGADWADSCAIRERCLTVLPRCDRLDSQTDQEPDAVLTRLAKCVALRSPPSLPHPHPFRSLL